MFEQDKLSLPEELQWRQTLKSKSMLLQENKTVVFIKGTLTVKSLKQKCVPQKNKTNHTTQNKTNHGKKRTSYIICHRLSITAISK